MAAGGGSIVSSSHFMIGPLEVCIVLAGLVLVLRWVYSVRRRAERLARERSRRDFGLLVPAVTLPRASDARHRQEVLSAYGIRATLAPAMGPDHGEPVIVTARGHVMPRRTGRIGTHVLVFPADLDRARELLAHAP